jgi:hypothetical protein
MANGTTVDIGEMERYTPPRRTIVHDDDELFAGEL